MADLEATGEDKEEAEEAARLLAKRVGVELGTLLGQPLRYLSDHLQHLALGRMWFVPRRTNLISCCARVVVLVIALQAITPMGKSGSFLLRQDTCHR